MSHQKKFLEAEWRDLVMANYQLDPKLLDGYLPPGTVHDLRDGVCYISLVGFLFLNTRIRGFRIPFHTDFEEVNLRFYVRFFDEGQWKRGTVFIREIVPLPAVALVANTIYGEKYEARSMRHAHQDELDARLFTYGWKKGSWNTIEVRTNKTSSPISADSLEEFIAEHYWGLSARRGKAYVYEVEHPKWKVYNVVDAKIHVDFGAAYGENFSFLTRQQPDSVFVAEGSEVNVRAGRWVVQK